MTEKIALDPSNGDVTALRVQAIVFALQFCNTQAAAAAASVAGQYPEPSLIAEDFLKVMLGIPVLDDPVTHRVDNVIHVDFGKDIETE